MKYILPLLCFLMFINCSNNVKNITCNVENPLENLAWLQQIKTTLEQSTSITKKQITQYTYKEKSVFMVDVCNDCADNLVAVYNFEGNLICEFGGIAGLNTCTDFDKKATNKIMLWQN